MTEYWFSTPIFVYDFKDNRLSAIQTEIDSCIDLIRMSINKSPWGDTVTTTFKRDRKDDVTNYNLVALRKELFWAINEYCNDLNYPNPDFKLIESWFNFCNYNGFQYDHTHPNCRISGVYYYKTTGNDGTIRFQNPAPFTQYGGFPSDRIGIDAASFKPVCGRLLLFPSWLTHRVNVNYTTSERISLTFNFL